MGCILFTCSGRGPEPDEFFFTTAEQDAVIYSEVFDAPLIGCYCNGI